MHAFINATHAIYLKPQYLEGMHISDLYIFILEWHNQTLKQLRVTDIMNYISKLVILLKLFSLLFSVANPPLVHTDGYFFPTPSTCCTILFVFWTVEKIGRAAVKECTGVSRGSASLLLQSVY